MGEVLFRIRGNTRNKQTQKDQGGTTDDLTKTELKTAFKYKIN